MVKSLYIIARGSDMAKWGVWIVSVLLWGGASALAKESGTLSKIQTSSKSAKSQSVSEHEAALAIYGETGGGRGACSKSVESLLRMGYRHYPSIRASRHMILGADAQKQSAKWNYFPTLSADLSGDTRRNGETVRLDQPLWTGGKLDAMSDMAAARYDEARHTLGENSYTVAEKILGIIQNYIQSTGEMEGFAQGKAQLEELSEMLDRRIDAGVSSESDAELLDARIAQIDADLTRARAIHAMSQAQLELMTGQPLRCGIGYEHDRFLDQRLSLAQLQASLIDTHPLLKKSASQIKSAEAERKNAEAAIMPNISLRAEYQRGSVYEDQDYGSDTAVYAAVTFTPGAGLSSMSNMQSAQYKVLQSQDELKLKEQELKDALVLTYADYRSASGRVESTQRAIDASQQVLESYKRLFIAGKRQWLDLVNASREVTQYRIILANLKATWAASAYRLALQSGQIQFEESER